LRILERIALNTLREFRPCVFKDGWTQAMQFNLPDNVGIADGYRREINCVRCGIIYTDSYFVFKKPLDESSPLPDKYRWKKNILIMV
jgi:hypothetical protein